MDRFTASAYLIAGDARMEGELLALLEHDGAPVHGNPDLYMRTYRIFGVDDAHELRARAITRAVGKYGRIFIISASGMTTEAQNALLKTIEEPPTGTRFFFIVPSPHTLLPTIRSRAQMLVVDPHHTNDAGQTCIIGRVDVLVFLKVASAKRIEMLKPLLEKDDDDKRDTGAVIAFLSAIEHAIAGKAGDVEWRGGFDALYNARKYATDKGALLKPLLESVALLVPQI